MYRILQCALFYSVVAVFTMTSSSGNCQAQSGTSNTNGSTTNSNFAGDRQEFIQSTTRLANGAIVTSTSTPGQPTQTVIGYGSTVQRASNQAGSSVVDQQFNGQQRVAQAYPSQDVFQAPNVQQQAQLQTPPQQLPVFQQPLQQGNFQQNNNIANQIPSLGAPGNYVTPPVRANRCCGNQSSVFAPGLGNSPGVATGSTGLQPLIPIRNLPPGTYVGQGAFGQPTAYVDGQPIRNLFRFLIFP